MTEPVPRPPPPSPRLNHHAARHVLRHSLLSFSSSFVTCAALIIAGVLLLSFRSALLAGTLKLSSIADRDPAVRSLLRRLSAAAPTAGAAVPSVHHHHHRRRPPFLQLTRVGTLDDDFFSDPESFAAGADRRNASRLPIIILDNNETLDSKIRVSELSPHQAPNSPFVFYLAAGDANEDAVDRDRVDLDVLGGRGGFDLGREEAAAIFYLLTLLSSTHTLAILGYIVSYTVAHGIVFVSVVAFLVERPMSVVETVYLGARSGVQRLTGFVFLRWAVRDAMVQFLCIWFFADVHDQSELFKLFVKVKLMPFSLSPLNPWSGPHDQALSGFFFVWAMIDTVVSVVFAVVPWVVFVDHNLRQRGLDVAKEGFYLVTLMPGQAVWIKFLEAMICGNLGSWMAMTVGGRLFAAVFHSVAEVYFMVVWLIFYFAARTKDGEAIGRRFRRRELDECLNGLR